MPKCNPKDIIGERVGRLTILSVLPEKDKYGFYSYNVKCDCGNEKVMLRSSLIGGKVFSCGCLNKKLSSIRTLERHKNTNLDLIGQKFGRLTVIAKSDKVNDDNKYPFVCKCECGNIVEVVKNNLVSGRTKSCGCYNSEVTTKRHQDHRDKFNPEEYIGNKYGKLTIIKYAGYEGPSKGHCFYVKCDCGSIKEDSVSIFHLGISVNSCGCYKEELHKERCNESIQNFNYSQYIGQKFGKLTITVYNGYINKAHRFSAICECGNTKNLLDIHNIRYGNISSCGCIRSYIYANSLDEYEKILNNRERAKFGHSKIRITVLERDNYTCYICKEKNDLQVHHIKPWVEAEELQFEEQNLITLCKKCHLIHAHGGAIGLGIDLEWFEKFNEYVSSLQQVENAELVSSTN